MNQLKHNFYFVIENWIGQWRAHQAHRRTVKQIRKHRRELNMRKREADELHKTTGKTYWILPDYNGVLQVLDKQNIKSLKRAKIMNREVTVIDLLLEAEYCTATNYFLILRTDPYGGQRWEYFKGTIDECLAKYNNHVYTEKNILGKAGEIIILTGHERVATIKDSKIIKH